VVTGITLHGLPGRVARASGHYHPDPDLFGHALAAHRTAGLCPIRQ
jgi:hypothetical protein